MKTKTIKNQKTLEALSGYAFILPQVIGFIVFVLIPLSMIFVYSFQQKNLLFGTSSFVGLANYKALIEDELFSRRF